MKGERPGGTYEATESLPRLHVPMRVTRDGPAKGRVRVTVEDAPFAADSAPSCSSRMARAMAAVEFSVAT